MDSALAGRFSSSVYVTRQHADDVDSRYGSMAKPVAQKKNNKKKKGRGIPLDMVFPRNPNEEDENFDILNPYYESKKPPPENFSTNEEDFPLLSDARKHTLTLHADDLINRTLDFYTTTNATPIVLIRSLDMKSLNAGGNPVTAYRDKLERNSRSLMDIKVFPRHNFLAARFSNVHDSVLAYTNLNNQMLHTHKMYFSYLREFPSREVILQHKRRLQEASSNSTVKPNTTTDASSSGLTSTSSAFPPLNTVKPTSDSSSASQTPTSASSYSSSSLTSASSASTAISSATYSTVESDYDSAASTFLSSMTSYEDVADFDAAAEDFLNSLL